MALLTILALLILLTLLALLALVEYYSETIRTISRLLALVALLFLPPFRLNYVLSGMSGATLVSISPRVLWIWRPKDFATGPLSKGGDRHHHQHGA